MSLRSLFAPKRLAHEAPARDEATSFWEERGYRLRRILEGGGWSIHDVVNGTGVSGAVREQWRLSSLMEQERAVEGYIAFLEYVDAVSRGELPRPKRTRASLFSL
jgi:hypothetical protein